MCAFCPQRPVRPILKLYSGCFQTNGVDDDAKESSRVIIAIALYDKLNSFKTVGTLKKIINLLVKIHVNCTLAWD